MKAKTIGLCVIVGLILLLGYFFISSVLVGNIILTDISPQSFEDVPYGPPFDVFNSDRMITTVTPEYAKVSGRESLRLKVTVDHPGAYIWKYGYYRDHSSPNKNWTRFSFPQPTLPNEGENWTLSFAEIVLDLPYSALEKSSNNFILTYSCKKQNGDWKCGCDNATQESPSHCGQYMLQIFNVSERSGGGSDDPDPNPEGTVNNPFKVYTVDDLQNMQNNLTAYYKLMNDINATDTRNWNSGLGFDPIGDSSSWGPGTSNWDSAFSGHLDGNKKTISNLYIRRFGESTNGLFGVTQGGSIKDLRLENPYVYGKGSAGGLIGDLMSTQVERVSVVGGKIYAQGSTAGAGGIAGLYSGAGTAIIKDCYTATTIEGGAYKGGLVGWQRNRIANSYSISKIMARSQSPVAGGLVGFQENAVRDVENSFSVNEFSLLASRTQEPGMFIGKITGNTDVINSSAYQAIVDGGCYGSGSQTGCTLIDNKAYFKDALNSPMNLWDFSSVWEIVPGSYPRLRGQAVASCQAGYSLCNHRCVDTTMDESHCGQCEEVCAEGETCLSGSCS